MQEEPVKTSFVKRFKGKGKQKATGSVEASPEVTTTELGTGYTNIQFEFEKDRSSLIKQRTSDDLPVHIKGTATWAENEDPKKNAYVVIGGETGQAYPVEFINDQWYWLFWSDVQGSYRVGSKSLISHYRDWGLGSLIDTRAVRERSDSLPQEETEPESSDSGEEQDEVTLD